MGRGCLTTELRVSQRNITNSIHMHTHTLILKYIVVTERRERTRGIEAGRDVGGREGGGGGSKVTPLNRGS